jgi:FixJ family two-component response regulator
MSPTTHGRLLILDDDATVGQLLMLVAQSVGFEAELTAEPSAFFAALSASQPSHVAVDLTLPGSSGTEVIERLGALGCKAGLIICSGASKPEVAAALALAAGLQLPVAGALNKPFSVKDLRALLQPPA